MALEVYELLWMKIILEVLKEREKGEKPYFHSYIFTYN